MKPSNATRHRARSISVDDIGDVSHSTDVPDPYDDSTMILKPQQPTTTTTHTNSDSRHSSHSLADFLMATGDMGNVTTITSPNTTTTNTTTTRPRKTNRRKISKDQKSVTSTTNSNPAENNIDPLMGSMEFEESQAS
jgi:hypothetical protein